MKTIFVSGASGIVGYGVLRSLQGLGYRLIGSTIYKESPANCFADIVEIAPKTIESNYIDWLSSIIQKYKIDMIIPGIEADMIEWNKNRKILEDSGTVVLLNNSKLINLCADKWNFYTELQENSSPYAIETRLKGSFSELKKDFGLPFLLKPRRGFASKGIVKVENEETFNEYKHNLGSIFMAQPIVGNINEEYTISAFFDKGSNLLYYQQLKRKLSKEGFTEIAETVELSGIKKVIEDLAEIFKPIGPTNFQFRTDNGKFKLLEINPRISSSTSIRKSFGYNESLMSIEYFLDGKIITPPNLKKGKAMRYTEDYITYDSHNI